jgi:predicted alpha/beta superfamily hydrolase
VAGLDGSRRRLCGADRRREMSKGREVARLLVALLAVLFAAPLAATPDIGRFVDYAAVPSANIAPPHVTVWLPPGYNGSKRRYPVLYMHDGQNLFSPERSSYNKIWAADKAAMRLIAAQNVTPFIIVGIDQPGQDRHRQYLPKPLYDGVSAPVRAKLDAFMKGPVLSDAYLGFLVAELKPLIDREFRTKADRDHTATAGSSMGGLISLYAISRYPKVFGRAACLSTHLPLGDPRSLPEWQGDVIGAWQKFVPTAIGAPAGRRIWFDHGDATLDALYAPYQEALDSALVKSGWRKGKDFESRIYPGAAHEENAWAARLDTVLGWTLKGWK